jgi:hypothetical protein
MRFLLVLCCIACRPGPPADARTDTATTRQGTTLDSAALHVLAFLRGQAPFEGVALADSISLYVGREAGGTRTTFARAQLREPSAWIARSSLGPYSLVPPSTLPKVTTKVGSHFVCREYPLATFFPDLARLPHVGIQLQPENLTSCLQTWNVTFVFDSTARPRLVAAVYDQFEW